jgi:hypothetical protein
MQRLYDVANAERAVARNESILHHRDAAASHFQRAYAGAVVLTAHDSRNQGWLLFKTRIECDWLRGEPGGSLPQARLRANLSAAAAILAANPNVREISSCLDRSGSAQTHLR